MNEIIDAQQSRGKHPRYCLFSSLDASIQTQIRCQLKCSLTVSTAENDLSISTLLDESISQQICRFADGSTNT